MVTASILMALLSTWSLEPHAAIEPSDVVAKAWVRCIDEAAGQTRPSVEFQARVSEAVSACASNESAFRKMLAQRIQSSGADSESDEAKVAIESSMLTVKNSIQARAERSVAAQPLAIWRGLISGSSPASILGQLSSMGMSAKVGKADSDGWKTLRVDDKLSVSGRKATVALEFYKDKFFWAEIRAVSYLSDTQDSYDKLIGALTDKYGKPISNNYLPDVVAASTSGVVLRRNAIFKRDGIRVDVTVNSSPKSRMASGDVLSRETMILTYWRDVDASAYAKAIDRDASQEAAAERAKLRDGL